MQKDRQTGRQVNIWTGREIEFKLPVKRDGLTSRGKVDDGEGPGEVMADNHLQGQVAEWCIGGGREEKKEDMENRNRLRRVRMEREGKR